MSSTGIDGKNRRGKSGIAVATGGVVAGFVEHHDAQTSFAGNADGDAITVWPDLTANGYNLTGTGHYYKTTSANLINGHPAVLFNGTSDLWENDATFPASFAQPFTIQFVCRSKSTSTQFLWISRGAPHTDATIGPDYEMSAPTTLFGGTSDATTAHVISCVCNGASSTLRVDGTVIQSGSAGANGITNGLNFGDTFPGGAHAFFSGSWGEILIYASALSTANLAANETALKAKWGTP